jgi:hypothetical protein
VWGFCCPRNKYIGKYRLAALETENTEQNRKTNKTTKKFEVQIFA